MEIIQGRHSESLNQGRGIGNAEESDTGVRNCPTWWPEGHRRSVHWGEIGHGNRVAGTLESDEFQGSNPYSTISCCMTLNNLISLKLQLLFAK